MNRCRLLLLAVLAIVALTGAGAWIARPRPGITRANAAKVREGMTLAEVEAILGGPARDEYSGILEHAETGGHLIGSYALEARGLIHASGPRALQPYEWASNSVIVVCEFADDHVHVSEVRRIPVRPAQDGWITDLRRWLRL